MTTDTAALTDDEKAERVSLLQRNAQRLLVNLTYFVPKSKEVDEGILAIEKVVYEACQAILDSSKQEEENV